MTTERANGLPLSAIASFDWSGTAGNLDKPDLEELRKENARLKEVLVRLTSIIVRNVTRET
jgi:hypothetical protein